MHKCTGACRHGQYDRRLHGVAYNFGGTAIMRDIEAWKALYTEIKAGLKARGKRRLSASAKNRLATKILIAIFKAV
ncbi:MAG: hypothetical protein QXH61_06345 [Candidatus Nezhaarchaeales archaeon]